MLKVLKEANINNKIVLLRLDLNVPISQNKIVSNFRIIKSIPTIEHLIKNNNKIVILSHLGRPKEGEVDEKYSLKPVALYLSEKIKQNIIFEKNWVNGVDFKDSNIIMCENVRFQNGEKLNSSELSRKISSLGDIFVFDAFGVSHRKESSAYGLIDLMDSYAGQLLENEINNALMMISNPVNPLTTIISGAKISTKITLISKLLNKSSHLIIGGGILNTFLFALGYNIGTSLFESDYVDEAKKIIKHKDFEKLIMPIDVVCSNNNSFDNPQTKPISMVQSNDKILDIGAKSIDKYVDIIKKSSTVFWNGPLGYVEQEPYDTGTVKIAKAIAISNCYSMVGGGDTLPIIEKLSLIDNFSYLSTGGGALLKFIEGKELPILKKLGAYT